MRKLIISALYAVFAMGAMQANAQGKIAQDLKVIHASVEEKDFSKVGYDASELNFWISDDGPGSIDEGGDGGWSWQYICRNVDVKVSSSLAPQGKYTYKASCLTDFNIATPWCEGAKGNGIGETITFDNVEGNLIRIVNGFALNNVTYLNNARAKRIRVDINNKPVAILVLEDVIGYQYFPFIQENRIEWLDQWDPHSVKFTILDVYPGAKYEDLCISEVSFSVQSLCFVKGSMVTMANGSKKAIEDIRKGDEILCFKGQTISTTKVDEVASVKHDNFVEYTLENGITVTCTPDHPLMCASKGWVSSDAAKTAAAYKGYANCKKIEVGDVIVTTSGNSKLVSVKEITGNQDSYTIVKAGDASNFVVNGIQVGVEQVK